MTKYNFFTDVPTGTPAWRTYRVVASYMYGKWFAQNRTKLTSQYVTPFWFNPCNSSSWVAGHFGYRNEECDR